MDREPMDNYTALRWVLGMTALVIGIGLGTLATLALLP